MVVLAFGTFDVIHIGHINYLKQAKKVAGKEKLIVIISRDKNAVKHKHKKLIHDEKERIELINSLNIVDKTILGEENPFEIILKLNPSKIVLGYDQLTNIKKLETYLEKNNLNIKIIRALSYKHTEKKSSLIKKKLLGIN
jgi:FAD synthetase